MNTAQRTLSTGNAFTARPRPEPAVAPKDASPQLRYYYRCKAAGKESYYSRMQAKRKGSK